MSKTRLVILAVAVLTFSLAQAQVDTLTIMHVNDTHSHLLPYGPKDSDGNWTWGGMARMATLVGMTRMTEPNVMLFHSGDLFVGDFMFQEYVGVAELEIMKALGYTALELGNHEFDLYPSTLKYVLNQAGFPAQGFPVLCANLDMTADPELNYFVQPYIIQEISGVRVGVFGLMTELTNQISNPSPVVVLPPLAQAQAWVDTLRIGHDCDVVILLSHMGIFEEQLAAATIGGIDIILGGHTHTVTPVPIVIGNTVLIQAGEFARYIGKLTIITNAGAMQDWSYQLLNIDSSVPAEPTLDGMISFLAAGVEADPRFGPVYTAVVAQASRDITKALGEGLCRDNPLGNMVADAMRSATATQIAIQPQGFISQTIYAGPVKGADIFQAVPYGFDQATGLGLKLVTFETNGMSLIYGLEFATYNLPYVEDFFLHGSDISYAYNSANAPGTRVDYGSIRINGLPLDPTATYTVTVPDAVVPFFSQIPGFQVNNLAPTGLSLYTVVKDFMAAHSPVAHYTEGRVFDLLSLEDPIAGTDAMCDVVWIFKDNGSISHRYAAISLQQHLERIQNSLEHNHDRIALLQIVLFKARVRILARCGAVSQIAADRLVYLAGKLAESINPNYAHMDLPEDEIPTPDDFALDQNYPNPFNGSTVISYTLPAGADVNLDIYDIMGRKVRTLVEGYQEAGYASVIWDGKDEADRNVSSGVYFYNLKAGDMSMTRKMNYIK